MNIRHLKSVSSTSKHSRIESCLWIVSDLWRLQWWHGEIFNLEQSNSTFEEQIGVYETVKGSLIEEEPEKRRRFSTIEFYSENTTKLYDIDSTYIDQLLGTYAANSSDAREEIEKLWLNWIKQKESKKFTDKF